ncbi:uncharacterized protein BT62DRAFT_935855, partial [Guyanagaster necrorhizus]
MEALLESVILTLLPQMSPQQLQDYRGVLVSFHDISYYSTLRNRKTRRALEYICWTRTNSICHCTCLFPMSRK